MTSHGDFSLQRLSAETTSPVLDDWEPKRIARPTGLPEWGVAPSRP